MIQNPQETLLGICQFLDLTCDQKYLEDCSKIVYHKATKTRYNLVWTETQKELVRQQMQEFPFLKDYRFGDWTILRLQPADISCRHDCTKQFSKKDVSRGQKFVIKAVFENHLGDVIWSQPENTSEHFSTRAFTPRNADTIYYLQAL